MFYCFFYSLFVILKISKPIRMDRLKFIAVVLAVLFSSFVSGFGNPPKSRTSGSSGYLLSNPPSTSATWSFYGENQIELSLANVSRFVFVARIKCISTSEEFEITLYPNDYFTNFSYWQPFMIYPVPWSFQLSIGGVGTFQTNASWH